MIAGLLQEAGVLITAVAVLIFAIAVAVAVLRRQYDRLDAKIGAVHLTAEEVKQTADAVNTAVNNVGPNMPTLVARVTGMDELLAQMSSRLETFTDDTNDWRKSVDGRLDRIEDHITRPTPTRKKAS